MTALSDALAEPAFVRRFWNNVVPDAGCWGWTGTLDDGYARISLRGRYFKAHRVSFELHHRVLADDELVDHRCHVKHCTNPGCLRVADRKRDGENLTGLNALNTSGYRGVTWVADAAMWQAQARHNGKFYRFGRFADPVEAAEAARQGRLQLFTYNDEDRMTNV